MILPFFFRLANWPDQGSIPGLVCDTEMLTPLNHEGVGDFAFVL